MNWLLALFQAITAGFEFGTKIVPPDSIREDNHEIQKPRLIANDKQRILNSCITYLTLHPRMSIDTFVDFKLDHLHTDDIAEIKLLLHQRFKKRK